MYMRFREGLTPDELMDFQVKTPMDSSAKRTDHLLYDNSHPLEFGVINIA
jgi:hypothetical protein